MKIVKLLSRLRSLKVQLWLDGDKLRCKAPAGVMTSELKAELSAGKDEILTFLRKTGGGPSKEALPLSPAQKRLWVIEQLFSRKEVAHVHIGIKLEGPCNLQHLERSLARVVARHQPLRGTFPTTRGKPQFEIVSKMKANLAIIDLRGSEDPQSVDTVLESEKSKPFNLTNGPLFRFVLFRIEDGLAILSITLHRLIANEASLNILLGDVCEGYNALSANQPLKLDRPTFQYSDFVKKQAKWLQSGHLAEQLAYWTRRLEECSQVLELPSDRPRPKILSFVSKRESFNIDEKTAQTLKALCASEHVEPMTVLLTSFFVLLYRYSSRSSVLIGMPVDNRSQDEIDHLIGCFYNTVVLRFDLIPGGTNKAPSFRDLLLGVEKTVREALLHGEVPIETLFEELQPERDLGCNPMFQESFSYQDLNSKPLAMTDLMSSRVANRTITSPYDLSLRMRKRGDGVSGYFEYSVDLFDQATIVRLIKHFETLLNTGINHPDQSISQLEILPDAEKNMLLNEWNDTSAGLPKNTALHVLVENQVHDAPDAVALEFDGKTLTYKELNEKANQLAWYLQSKEVKPDTLVGILMDRSLDTVIGILGIIKAGGAYVPLNPTYPKARLDFILKDTKLEILLIQSDLADKVKDFGGQLIRLDTEKKLFSRRSKRNPSVEIGAENLAYVIYTSGPEGVPNGVMNTQLGVCNRLVWMKDNYRLGGHDRILQKTSISQNESVWELFSPLIAGARLVIPEPGSCERVSDLIPLVVQNEVTVLHFVPLILEEFLAQPDVADCRSLKKVICSGETLPFKIQENFFSAFKNAELHNLYGPTEAAGDVTFWNCNSESKLSLIPIGRPISNIQIYILDLYMQPVPVGVPGELYVGGAGVARGYLNRSDLTQQKFIDNPFVKGSRIFRTGALARYLKDGNIEFLGRMDHQVNLRGFRVELPEIEANLVKHPNIHEAVVLMREDSPGQKRLAAYYTSAGDKVFGPDVIESHLRKTLPEFMIPAYYVRLDAFPLDPKGMIDRSAFPAPQGLGVPEVEYPRAYNEVEQVISRVWQKVLGVDHLTVYDNFFEIGGDSFLMAQVYAEIPNFLKQELSLSDMYNHPTIHSLDLFLENEKDEDDYFTKRDDHLENIARRQEEIRQTSGMNLAVVGMAGRFPGANNPDELWQVIVEGRETISHFSDEELLEAGVVDKETIEDPDYVKSQGVLDNVEDFDAAFFDFTPREAQITDPQHRLFLECAWEAIESAGYATDKYDGRIGVFGGVGMNKYFSDHLSPNQSLWDTIGAFPIIIGNDKDNLCARVSYKLGLRGPAVGVQTYCSSGLVAVHMAARSLRSGDCDMALAGGVFLGLLNRTGYVYEEGMLYSPNGHTRCFDVDAKGIVPSQGVGLILIKRLEDAVADGDMIHAVIKGSAVNNDGNLKENYTSYSVVGQVNCLRAAQAAGGLTAADIGYVETSSNASKIGDPIEIEALTEVFKGVVDKPNGMPIGAIKPNIGSVDNASGIAALMKVVFALKNKKLPPTINFTSPSPKTTLASSPFHVNTQLKDWDTDGKPRRAGVSAFGLGGTNAHVVLEEPPEPESFPKTRPWLLLTMSAKTPSALEEKTKQMTTFLKKNSRIQFSDACHTLQVGRQDFKHRRVLVCQNLHSAVLELAKRNPTRLLSNTVEGDSHPIAFMFPGQGAQYMNMGQQLYQVELTYREEVDRCWGIIKDIAPDLYNSLTAKDRVGRTEKLYKTYVTQPTTFVVEYALSKLLIHWGIKPEALIGNSLGEYVAACLAGVFSLEDALKLVVNRGRLMQSLPPGDQLFVGLPESELTPLLHEELSLAGVAGANQTIASGSEEAILDLKSKLNGMGVKYQRIFSSHAFHSYMMEPIIPEFAEAVGKITLNPPKIKIVSCITGDILSDEEACDPQYWAQQMRLPVRFSKGIGCLFQDPNRILLEVGPEKTLSNAANNNPHKAKTHRVLPTMRHPQEEDSDIHCLLTAVGKLWHYGVPIDWPAFNGDKQRYRTSMPGYPFDRQPHWIKAAKKLIQTDDDLYLEPDEYVEEDEVSFSSSDAGYVAPRDIRETQISKVWENRLGVPRVGIHDDFFELGGTSLIALGLVKELGEMFSVPLASHILLQKRTVATLNEYIKDNEALGDQGAPKALVEIQKGKPPHNIPLFMVHPIGGDLLFYKDLPHNLGVHQPVYGFRALSLFGAREPYTRIQEQAAEYIKELLELRPEGPYLIGGSSYGGVVAFEMCQQLRAAGYKVPLLVIIDSPGPGQMPGKSASPADYLVGFMGQEVGFTVDELKNLELSEQVEFIVERANRRNLSSLIPPDFGVSMVETWMGHQEAMFHYFEHEAKAYAGRAIYFLHSEPWHDFPRDVHKAWIDLVKGGFEYHQTPGNHYTMNWNPHAKKLAFHLRRAIRSVGK